MTNCKNCGAPLMRTPFGTLKCDYCGTVYDEVRGSLIVLEHPRVNHLRAEVAADRRIANEIGFEPFVKELTKKIAEQISAYLEIRVKEDILRDAVIIRGDMRIVDPDFRF